MIREATTDDAAAFCDIYNHYVASTVVTFEERPVSIGAMQRRIREVPDPSLWLAADDGGVRGFAFAREWSGRSAYRFTVETTVYLEPRSRGRGTGSQLYEALIARLRSRGLHSAIGVVALPNPGSVALHEKAGFRKVAHLREVGRKFDRWIDVGFWERLL